MPLVGIVETIDTRSSTCLPTFQIRPRYLSLAPPSAPLPHAAIGALVGGAVSALLLLLLLVCATIKMAVVGARGAVDTFARNGGERVFFHHDLIRSVTPLTLISPRLRSLPALVVILLILQQRIVVQTTQLAAAWLGSTLVSPSPRFGLCSLVHFVLMNLVVFGSLCNINLEIN